MLNNLQQMHLNFLQKKVIQKTAETNIDLSGNKIANGFLIKFLNC